MSQTLFNHIFSVSFFTALLLCLIQGFNPAPRPVDRYGLPLDRLRVVPVEKGQSERLPPFITAFFTASEMNWDPANGNHEPWTGRVRVGTNEYPCSQFDPHFEKLRVSSLTTNHWTFHYQ